MEKKQPETESTPSQVRPFAQVRRTLALSTGKLAQQAGRLFHLGGGSSLPGKLAGTIDPSLLRTISQESTGKRVLISGSNGKTSTAHILATFARQLGLTVVYNHSGANLLQGVISTVVSHANLKGALEADLLLFEVDEAALAQAVHEIKPEVVVITNLFRDQQERHRDPASLAVKIEQALAMLPDSSTVWLNSNDPLVANLGQSISAQRRFFGITIPTTRDETDATADTTYCPRCHHDLSFAWVEYSHLGQWSCPGCGWRMPSPEIFISRVIHEPVRPGVTLFSPQTSDRRVLEDVWWPITSLHGTHNLYNVCAALAVLESLSLDWTTQHEALQELTPVFARMEPIPTQTYPLFLTYIKNPVSLAVNLARTEHKDEQVMFHFALQSGDVDGYDFSWLWDLNLSRLLEDGTEIVCSGDQATMMALCLKYTDVKSSKVRIIPDHESALLYTLQPGHPHARIYTFATATATQLLRSLFVKRGWVKPL